MSEAIHVSQDEFEEKVLGSTTPVIVDFWAPWCGPCRMVAPILDELAGEYPGQIVIAKVNTDENQQLAIQYGIQSIPTMMFIKDGEVVDRLVGFGGKPPIQQRILLAAQSGGGFGGKQPPCAFYHVRSRGKPGSTPAVRRCFLSWEGGRGDSTGGGGHHALPYPWCFTTLKYPSAF